MNCPVCKKKVPFGLAIHMLAAHGSGSTVYDREARRVEAAEAAPQKKKRPRGGRRRPRQGGSQGRKNPFPSKLS